MVYFLSETEVGYPEVLLRKAVQTTFQEVGVDESHSVSVMLTTIGGIRAINHRYRGIDRATNVLSFPLDFPAEVECNLLGDIVIAPEVVKKEVDGREIAYVARMAHLLVHGVLHLLGYTHNKPDAACVMEAIEIRSLGRLNIANPYGS